MRVKAIISTAALCLAASMAQAVVNDTIIMSTDVGNNDELYKLNPNDLTIQARHALGYFDNIGSLGALPNGNFALIPVRGNGSSRVFLMHTDLFTGMNSIEVGNTGSISGDDNGFGGRLPDGGSIGGMTNRQGDIFLSGKFGVWSGGARFNGLDDALPKLDEANQGFFDDWQDGDALSDGSWVIAGNGGMYDSIEVRSRNLPGTRLGRIYGFDHYVKAIKVNSFDHIGLAYPAGANARVSAWHYDPSIGGSGSQINMDGTANFVLTDRQYVDITSLSNGDFVVAANDPVAGEGFLYRLRENTDLNVLEQVDVQGGFGLITKLEVQSDDDVLVGAQTAMGGLDPSANTLYRYSFTLDAIQSSQGGFGPINNLIALPGIVQQPGWAIDNSGDWNTAVNWSDGNIPNGVGSVAVFGSIITSAQTVFTNTPVTVGTLKFDNPNTYTIDGGGSLTIEVASGLGSVSVLQGSQKINLPITFASDTTMTVASGATLTIGNPTTINANKTVTKSGALVMQASLTIGDGGGLVLASGPTQLFGAPSLGTGAKIDVKNTSVTIDYTGQASPASTIKAQLTSGYASGAWNGEGINTSSAVAGQTALGWKDDAANESIMLKYTYYGDANLDGQVDISDLGALATAWQTSAVWSQGDFDYSGFVDISDLGKLATNWQLGVGSPLGPSFDEALASVGLAGVSVPEPASAGLIAIAAFGLLNIRRNARSRRVV